MDQTERVGANIKRFRELAGLSKSELARRANVSPTAVHNWEENGVVPRMEVMLTLEKILEVCWMQLMSDDAEGKTFSTNDGRASSAPEMSRSEKLSQFKRQIAALFEVASDKVEIVIRI